MNTLKFLTKSYESNPYLRAFFDNAAKIAQDGKTPLIAAFASEADRLNGLLRVKFMPEASVGSTAAPERKKPGPPKGFKRVATATTAPAKAETKTPVDPNAAQVIKLGTAAKAAETKPVAKKKPGPKPGTKKGTKKADAKDGGIPVIEEPTATPAQ